MKKTLLHLMLFLVFCFCPASAYAVNTPDIGAPPWPITSDFGPRNADGTWFHKGIDYGGTFGEVIHALEGGTIAEIDNHGDGWYIKVASAAGKFTYLHIFSNGEPSISGDWELRYAMLIESSYLFNNAVGAYVIIHRSYGVVDKVFSSVADKIVVNPDDVLGCFCFRDVASGMPIRTQSTVKVGDAIAPVGNSGTKKYHLHLGLNQNADNPLYLVAHNKSAPVPTIEAPVDGHTFTADELKTPYPIKVRVDSTGGLDLDKVNILIYEKNDPAKAIPLGGNVTFSYGGKPGEGKTVNITSASVMPQGNTPGTDLFIYAQDFKALKLPSGEHTLVVQAIDVNENYVGEATSKFTIESYPVVESTTPTDGSYNVTSSAPVTITFDHEMNTASVQAAITIQPSIDMQFAWSGDGKTVTISHSEFAADTYYTVTVVDTAKDVDGAQLDGDKDYKAGGKYVFKFTTTQAALELSMKCDYSGGGGDYCWVKGGEHTVTAKLIDAHGNPVESATPPKLELIMMGRRGVPVAFAASKTKSSVWTGTVNITKGADGMAVFNPGNMSVSGVYFFMVDTTPPKTEFASAQPPSCPCPFTPIAINIDVSDSDNGSGVGEVVPTGLGLSFSGCYQPGSYDYGASSITDKVGNKIEFAMTKSVNAMNCDHPDDNYSVSASATGPVSGPQGGYTNAEVVTLEEGNFDDFGRLMDKVKKGVEYTQMEKIGGELVGTSKLLVIPSGGFYGLENSEFFKASLDEFVKQGGTLVVFSQQHGYEFSALPVPIEADGTKKLVKGYGWTEDQSCFANSVYVDTYSQILSGQTSSTPSLNVDGYFTDYPSMAIVLLRRTANGQPAIIMYPYGNGWVIATSMYSDWAYGHSQASSDEIALVRDLVTWAREPDSLPQVKPGEQAQLSLLLENTSENDVAQVKITVSDPDRNVMFEETVAFVLTARDIAELPFSFNTLTNAVFGIWHVDYTFLDANGNIIQPQAETDSGRFAVSNPTANPYKSPDFNFSVQSDKEYYQYSSPATFTFNLWNNTGTDRRIKATWGLAHHNYGWDNVFNNIVTVPAHGHTSFTYVLSSVRDLDRLRAKFYDDTGKKVGSAEKGFRMYFPVLTGYSVSDKVSYARREAVSVTVYMENKTIGTLSSRMEVEVKYPNGNRLFVQNFDVSLAPGEKTTQDFSFVLPIDAPYGSYIINTHSYSGSRVIGGNWGVFNVSRPQLSVDAVIPMVFGVVDDLQFNVTNTGSLIVPSASLLVSLKDPSGAEVWSTTRALSNLQPGASSIYDFVSPLSVSNALYGDYNLVYSIDYGDGVKTGLKVISNKVTINTVMDRQTYKARETANLTVGLVNTGVFNLNNVSVTVSMPDTGYSSAVPVSLNAGAGGMLDFAVPIPATVIAGLHDINITFVLSSGSVFEKRAYLNVPEAAVLITHNSQAAITAGDTINFSIENTGGVDANATLSVSLAGDRGILYQNETVESLPAGGASKTLSFQVPLQAATGVYALKVVAVGVDTGKSTTFSKMLNVPGLMASIIYTRNKSGFLTTEAVPINITLRNDGLNINNALLRTEVFKKCISSSGAVCPDTVYWQKEESITLGAGLSQTFDYSIGPIAGAGEYYYHSTLLSSTGQTVSNSGMTAFSTVVGNIAMSCKMFKESFLDRITREVVYVSGMVRPYQNVGVVCEITNMTSINISTPLTVTIDGMVVATIPNMAAKGTNRYTAGRQVPIDAADGVYTISGSVTQGSNIFAEASASYEVGRPILTAELMAPDIVGGDPFTVRVEVSNSGTMESVGTYSFSSYTGWYESYVVIDGQEITILPGETRVFEYRQQTDADANFEVWYAGGEDSSGATKRVAFGLHAYMQFSGNSGYAILPEGKGALPLTIWNTGEFDATVEVNYTFYKSTGVVWTETKSYAISKGLQVEDTLNYDLPLGYNRVVALSKYFTSQREFYFTTAKESDIRFASAPPPLPPGGLAPPPPPGWPTPPSPPPDGTSPQSELKVNAAFYNAGWNTVKGYGKAVAIKDGVVAWSAEQAAVLCPGCGTVNFDSTISLSVLAPGTYDLKVAFYDDFGKEMVSKASQFTVLAPTFVITERPSYQTYPVGGEVAFNFSVTNTGNQEGRFEFHAKAMDELDAVRVEWLKPGEQKTLVFDFNIPVDIEAKDYFADYELKGVEKGQVKFRVEGMSLSATAGLDKNSYAVGDAAQLTLQITDTRGGASNPDVNLFARVNYGGYEESQVFTIGVNPSAALTFNVPLAAITGEKLFYGIYYDTGRSIHLNSLYIYDAGAPVAIITDKQVYNPGETIGMSITGTASGTLTLDGPGGYSETFAFSGSASKSLTLPTLMTAGTYPINWRVTDAAGGTISGSHAIDVAGIQVKVREATLDKAKYASTDNIKLALAIESNTDLSATIKTWIAGPDGGYMPGASRSVNLVSTGQSTLVSLDEALSTTVLGIHRLIYGVYSGEMLLTSGAEAFDVGDAVLLGLATDKQDYPNGTEAVNATTSLFGNASAALEFFVDNVPVSSETVVMNGFTTVNSPLAGVVPGAHTLKAVLTSGGLTSTKETSFVYGSGLADLVVMLQIGSALNRDNMLSVTVTIINQGKLPSTATTVTLYDGPPSSGGAALKTFDVPGLAPGESVSFTYELDASGRAGSVTLYASTANVYEFDNANNDKTASTQIPELAFYTTIPSGVHYAGDGLPVDAVVTNLSKAVVAGAELATVIKDAAGNVVYTAAIAVPAISPQASVAVTTTWNVADDTLEGDYAVSQRLTMGQNNYGSSVQTVHILPGKDFTLASAVSSLRIEVGGEKSTEIILLPIRGFTDVVTLSLSNAPLGVNVSLTQEAMLPSETVGLKIVTSNGAPAGSYILTITGTGGGRTHTLEVGLDITDFSMTITPVKGQVAETETGEFAIELNPLNGFDGIVTMDVTGLPKGMRAAFDVTQAMPPAASRLMLRTSKWLLPGVYPVKLSAKGTTAYHEETVTLTVVMNPEIAPGIITTSGPGPQNEPVVKTFRPDGVAVASFSAFDGAKYGANAVAGDLNGDGADEIVVAEGPDPNGLSNIRVFNKHGAQIASMELQSFVGSYGLMLAVGDIDGDWAEELIVGSGSDPKATGLVKVYKYDAGVLRDTGINLYPYQGYGYTYGANVAVADIDGDGRVEIVTAPGPDPNAPAKIKAFKLNLSAGVGAWTTTESAHFNANFSAKDGYGANVAACDLNGDGVSEIIVAAGPDPAKAGEVIRAYNVNGTLTGASFAAYDGYRYGAYVSCGDMYRDGRAEIVTGAGPDPKNKSVVRIFSGEGTLLKELQAYPDTVKYGVKPSVGRVGVQ